MHPGEPWAQPGVRHVTVDGIPVAVETVHNGAPPGQAIAWLHGLGSSAIHAFAKVVRHPALAGTVSLLIDLPGHGWSGGPDGWAYIMEARADNVSSVLRGILNRPVTLMGHSMGGTIAIACAARSPGGVGRLIVAEIVSETTRWSFEGTQHEERFVRAGYAALVRVTERQTHWMMYDSRDIWPGAARQLGMPTHSCWPHGLIPNPLEQWGIRICRSVAGS